MGDKITLAIFVFAFISCNGQKPFGTEHLKLEKTITLPHVSGRIDHLAINSKDNIVYVAALGNNTVEAVDLQKGQVVHTISGLDEPQGICYLPDRDELVVANGGSGKCIFYSASNYGPIGEVDLRDDADNVRYDARNKKIFVGYGNGGIAV